MSKSQIKALLSGLNVLAIFYLCMYRYLMYPHEQKELVSFLSYGEREVERRSSYGTVRQIDLVGKGLLLSVVQFVTPLA